MIISRYLPLLVVSLLLPRPASAQAPVVREDPVPMVIAMSGVVVVSAGFGLMLHARRGADCDCGNTAQIAGGVAVVAAGVTMVYLGLRARRVVLAPTRNGIGATATVRWGGAASVPH
jgi:hypothetical protein